MISFHHTRPRALLRHSSPVVALTICGWLLLQRIAPMDKAVGAYGNRAGRPATMALGCGCNIFKLSGFWA